MVPFSVGLLGIYFILPNQLISQFRHLGPLDLPTVSSFKLSRHAASPKQKIHVGAPQGRLYPLNYLLAGRMRTVLARTVRKLPLPVLVFHARSRPHRTER
jgi:hypothetical protein